MWKFLNVHPEGKRVGDCVKRAITTVAKMDYHQVQLELNRYKKVTGCEKFNNTKNCNAYVEKVLHMVKISFPAEAGKERMNGERFCKAYPKGRYILRMAGHWTACIDGVIYDTWDCTDKCVYNAWMLPSKEQVQLIQAAEDEALKKKEQAKAAKEKLKAQEKKIKDKYKAKMKPLQKKLKELEKQMAKEIEELKKGGK